MAKTINVLGTDLSTDEASVLRDWLKLEGATVYDKVLQNSLRAATGRATATGVSTTNMNGKPVILDPDYHRMIKDQNDGQALAHANFDKSNLLAIIRGQLKD